MPLKKFGEYLKEFIVITVSIVIAFWVENYRESRKASADTKSLLVTIHGQVISDEGYLQHLCEFADKHSFRFDSIAHDLEDNSINAPQQLADIAIAYVPYIAELGENSGIESLQNSGLLSSMQNDSALHELIFLNVRKKTMLREYLQGWKHAQEKLREAVTHVYGSRLQYDFQTHKMVVSTSGAIVVSKEEAERIRFQLINWITLMQQYKFFISNLREESILLRQRYWHDKLE